MRRVPRFVDTPILDALRQAGTVWEDETRSYVGTAADGTVVLLGTVGYEENVELYLREHPTPETW